MRGKSFEGPVFSEGIELLIPAGEGDDVFDSQAAAYRPAFVDSILNDLQAEGIDTTDAELTVQNYGYGADGLSLAVILSGLTALFLSGKKIEENFDAWIRLGQRLAKAVAKLRRRGIPARLSEPAAASVALASAAENAPAEASISLVSSIVLPLSNRSLNPEFLPVFLQHPDRHYVFVLKVGADAMRVVCLTSDGRVSLVHELPLDVSVFLKKPPGT
jgi:hypothetical protein